MKRTLKSEMLKWKGSRAFYLMLVFSALQYVSIPPYVWVVRNPIILENLVFLAMLAGCILVAILSILMYEQEEKANHFQNIQGNQSSWLIWSMKLLLADLALVVPSLFLWLVVGLELKQPKVYLFIGLLVWLLFLFLNHFHLFLTLIMGKGGNLLFAFIECLAILFATNKTFLSVLWLPVALPVNAILLYPSERVGKIIICLVTYSLLFYLASIVMVIRKRQL